MLDNIFREYYLRRRAEGLPYKKAILATTHKLCNDTESCKGGREHPISKGDPLVRLDHVMLK